MFSFSNLKIKRKVSLIEKIIFTRNLHLMIVAGLPIVKSLELLSRQTSSPLLSQTILLIIEDLKNGFSMADSLAKFQDIFSDLYVSMIRVGELSGTLEKSLKVLAEQMKREHDLKSRVKGAMIYPAVVIFAMLVVGILMMIFVVPELASTFRELKVELPNSTLFIIGISEVLKNYWPFLLLLLIIIIFLLKMVIKTKIGKFFLDWLFLKTPVISGLTVKLNSAMFSRTFSSLIESGIPIIKGLEITASTLKNHYFIDDLQRAANFIQEGKTLSEILADSKFYPFLLTQMVTVGEETGQLVSILSQLASFYEEEVNNVTKNLSSIIEPLIMVIIGIFIGFFAVAMIQPMYSLVNFI